MPHRSWMSAVLAAVATATAAPSAHATAVVSGDLSVQGRLCAGSAACVADEPFGEDVLRVKAERPRLTFVDTSRSLGYPSTDWAITAGGAGEGSADALVVSDLDAGTDPLRILAGAPTDALLVLPSGTVALRDGTLVQRADATTMTAPAPADAAALVTALAGLPLTTYASPGAPSTRRIGPSAADFTAAFGLGEATGLAPSDAAGVALAVAKELAARVEAIPAGGGGEPAWQPPGLAVAAAAHAANAARDELRDAEQRLAKVERTHRSLRSTNRALERKVKRLEKQLARRRGR